MTRRLPAAIPALLFLLLLTTPRCGFADARSAPAPAPLPPLKNGAAAPDFTVRDRHGNPVKLSYYKGKTVVLDLWATWCEPCQDSMPRINALARRYTQRNVVFLAINIWDGEDVFKEWLQYHARYDALKFAIDPAPQNKDFASVKYHITTLPTQFVISPRGKIVASFLGYLTSDANEAELRKAIKAAQSMQ